uniref:Uncharacterized protein n=1 Tax=Anguilla anguilla TaxID=7936 RepID=A0A0E9VA93_ANGAN
MGETGPCF